MITRTCHVPSAESRLSAWAARWFGIPADLRPTPKPLTLPPSKLLRRLEAIQKRAKANVGARDA